MNITVTKVTFVDGVSHGIIRFFQVHPRVAIAFSGGVDSAYLLYAAVNYAAKVHAYYAKSAFQPQFELDDANGWQSSLAWR
jgi:PP-loop superfamily ATP-utilizing enzyme